MITFLLQLALGATMGGASVSVLIVICETVEALDTALHVRYA